MATYSTENLPPHEFNGSETKKYREWVCSLFDLYFMPIGGDGNCFFESVTTLLALVHNHLDKLHNLDASECRRRVIEWLRNCGGRDGPVFEQCMDHMAHELAHALTILRQNKWVSQKPQSLADYLDWSSKDGVWVQGKNPDTTSIHHHHFPPQYTTGFHWPLAVATLFKVCVVVVIHGHDHLHCIGDPAHPRIHLYKKVPYIHTPPHQHTPYTTSRHTRMH